MSTPPRDPFRAYSKKSGKPCGDSSVSEDNRRKAGRVFQEMLECNLGTVLDLSAGGMRVQVPAEREIPPLEFEVHFQGERLPETLIGRLAWNKPHADSDDLEIGVDFVAPSEDMIERLTEIARHHRLGRTF